MYKVGIIGLGKVGSTYDDDPLVKGIYSHAGAYNINSETTVVAGSDIDRQKLKAFGRKLNIKALYSEYSEMLKNENLDIISVCTGGGIHYDIVKEAAKYDIEAVYCEKPMTDTLEKADEIIKICREKKIVLAVNHLRRWDTGFQSVKKFIDDKKIGDIQKFSIYYTKGIINSGSHLFDILYYFFGDVDYIRSNYAYKQKDFTDPTLDVYVKFKSGLSGVLLGLNDDFFTFSKFDIFGTLGVISIIDSGYKYEYYKVRKSEKFSVDRDLIKTESPFVSGLDNAMPNAVTDIVECIRTGKKPLCSGDDARYSVAAVNAALESVKNNSEKIFISN